MSTHIHEERLNELLKPGGPHLIEDELEHIADCGDCGQRVFEKLFPPNHRVRKESPEQSAEK